MLYHTIHLYLNSEYYKNEYQTIYIFINYIYIIIINISFKDTNMVNYRRISPYRENYH